MRALYENEENYYLLAKACSPKEKERLTQAYIDIDKNLENHGLVCVAEGILSATTYKAISELITIPERTTVIDCGCCLGLQQVFFHDCKRYIGIDMSNSFYKISDNAEFIQGDIREVLPTLQIDNNTVGISVLCGSVWEDIGKVIRSKFNKLIIV